MAAVSWALYSNLARRWAGLNDEGAVTYFLLMAGIALLILRIVSSEQSQWTIRSIMEIGIMGLFTATAYVFWDLAMRKGNVTLVMAGSYFTPLLSTLVVMFYLNVEVGIRLWIGCLAIITGSFISWRSVYDKAMLKS